MTTEPSDVGGTFEPGKKHVARWGAPATRRGKTWWGGGLLEAGTWVGHSLGGPGGVSWLPSRVMAAARLGKGLDGESKVRESMAVSRFGRRNVVCSSVGCNFRITL